MTGEKTKSALSAEPSVFMTDGITFILMAALALAHALIITLMRKGIAEMRDRVARGDERGVES